MSMLNQVLDRGQPGRRRFRGGGVAAGGVGDLPRPFGEFEVLPFRAPAASQVTPLRVRAVSMIVGWLGLGTPAYTWSGTNHAAA